MLARAREQLAVPAPQDSPRLSTARVVPVRECSETGVLISQDFCLCCLQSCIFATKRNAHQLSDSALLTVFSDAWFCLDSTVTAVNTI